MFQAIVGFETLRRFESRLADGADVSRFRDLMRLFVVFEIKPFLEGFPAILTTVVVPFRVLAGRCR